LMGGPEAAPYWDRSIGEPQPPPPRYVGRHGKAV